MNRLTFVLIWIAFAGLLLTFMVIAWRGRTKRDSGFALPAAGLHGESIANFTRVNYVSTTPAGAPFERVAIPGLSFKGFADLAVQTDGVVVQVAGEEPVELPVSQITGSATASRRAGKAVERDGLALLLWKPQSGRHTDFESSFRFNSSAEQLRFFSAIEQITLNTTDHSRSTADLERITQDSITTQEDA